MDALFIYFLNFLATYFFLKQSITLVDEFVKKKFSTKYLILISNCSVPHYKERTCLVFTAIAVQIYSSYWLGLL